MMGYIYIFLQAFMILVSCSRMQCERKVDNSNNTNELKAVVALIVELPEKTGRYAIVPKDNQSVFYVPDFLADSLKIDSLEVIFSGEYDTSFKARSFGRPIIINAIRILSVKEK